jgi:F0F1-type ATP synthase epsilon subunit
MPDTFQLEIVTPEKLVVKEAADEAQIPGLDGYLGILPGHAPLITELGVLSHAPPSHATLVRGLPRFSRPPGS